MARALKQHHFFFGICLFLFSCVKDKPQPDSHVIPVPEPSKRVFIVNEGNFSSGNSSVSLYNTASKEVQEDYFKTVNNTSLGDVAQSMAFINGQYYLVVNNSGKIVVCDKGFKIKANITGLNSPRYILQVSTNKAYVSDYKSGSIQVIDLNNNSISSSIPFPGWSEQMLMLNNRVFVCNVSREYLYVIDADKDKVEDSVWVGKNSAGIEVDLNQKLWVLSSGDQGNSAARFSVISPLTLAVEKTFIFPASHQPFKLAINGRGDSLYYVDKDVYVMPVQAASLPEVALIKAGQSNFYGIGIHPVSSDIYLSDALDYVQRSHITVYSATGSKKNEFKAGINANGFYFD